MNDIENGMIVGEEWWDPQQRTQRTMRCVCCKENCAVEELTRFQSGDLVCEDCLDDYIEAQGAEYEEDIIFRISALHE